MRDLITPRPREKSVTKTKPRPAPAGLSPRRPASAGVAGTLPVRAFDGREAKAVAKAIEVAVQEAVNRFGLEVAPFKTGEFTDRTLSLKLEVTTLADFDSCADAPR
jgi:hypothetical protein